MSTLALCPSESISTATKPRLIGAYRVQRWVAEGSFAHVALAIDTNTYEQVALKVLKPEWRGSMHLRRQLCLEGKAVGEVHHPRVVGYRGLDADHDIPYLALEWIEGPNLRQAVEHSAWTLPKTLRAGLHIAQGLAAIHARRWVHADLKPENILSRAMSGELVVADLGAVRLSGQLLRGPICGSPRYMAPEQRLGGVCDGRTDLYAFGMVMQELMARVPPDARRHPAWRALAALVSDCARPKAPQRPESARLVAHELCQLLYRVGPCFGGQAKSALLLRRLSHPARRMALTS